MIRLRGHHFVCLHFYRGEGYSPEYVKNLEDVLYRAMDGEEIEAVACADDICRACPTLQGEKCVAKPGMDAEIRQMDAEATLRLNVDVGSKVFWREIKTKMMAAPKEWLAAFCRGCLWEKVCAEKKKSLGLI